ncbi:MAG: hypothetical protein UT50_C0005G0015 [Candidatus Moranbacteria bacterium GW2011_GWA2_39_41]|nr:MAG: hypothetical protein UT50_C0005G0015 [Candidatus Moranbacteria bacterium GW2011_GWA2_39_41]
MSKSQCQKKFSKNAGFTLIEALTVLFIFSLITMTFYSIFSVGTRYILESKNRLGGVALANERMEIIRNLKYDDIGIVGGIPSGNLVAEEDVTESKHAYHVKTFVQYVDDPFDGVLPADVIPTDYKRVKVTVSWNGVNNAQSDISLVARFVPAGIEQAASGGILAVNIMGSNGIGVPQASVHITNSSVSPAVNVTAMTDDTGNLMLPGAKQSIQGYNITVTKNGYETVETIDPDSVSYSVTDTPASVVEGMLNMKSIVQDKFAKLKIITTDAQGEKLPGVNFSIEGGRILGSDMMFVPAKPTYNLKSDNTSDSDGEVDFGDVSPGQFFIFTIVKTGYTLIGLSNFANVDLTTNEYTLLKPAEDVEDVTMRFAENDVNSLVVQVVRDADNTLIENAEVTLSNSTGFSEVQTTPKSGSVFFPVSTTPLAVGTYDLKVTMTEFNDYMATVDVDEDKLVIQQIKLVANEL